MLYASGASARVMTSWFSQGIVWGISQALEGKPQFQDMIWGFHFIIGGSLALGVSSKRRVAWRILVGVSIASLDMLSRNTYLTRCQLTLCQVNDGEPI